MKKIKDWDNLLTDDCPSCYKAMEEKDNDFVCECGFKISKKRKQEIVSDMVADENEGTFNEWLITNDKY